MSGSGDGAEEIHEELVELNARLARLRALAERIERCGLSSLESDDRVLVEELVSKYLAEAELAEGGEAAVEESAVWAGGSTSECEWSRGPFGFFTRWMVRR